MLVLGIDPGTAITGYGFVQQAEDGSLAPQAYGVIRTESVAEMPERLLALARELQALIQASPPTCCAIEELYFQRNVSTAIQVGQARGVALLTMAEEGIEIAEYSPRQIKLAVTGHGGADKRQMQEMVRLLLGLQERPQPDDAADALAVAICHLHSFRLQQKVKAAP